MTEAEQPYREAPVRQALRGPRPGDIRIGAVDQGLLNTILAVFLLLAVALVPVPLGGNRPLVWMATTLAGGLVGVWYATMLLLKRARPRLPLSHFAPETLGLIVFLLYASIQLAPLARWFPIGVALPDGELAATRVSLTPGDTWLSLVGVGTYGLFFLLAAQAAANRRRARFMLYGLFAIVALHALFALVNLHYLGDTVLGLDKTQYQGFATGTFLNRNSFATFAAAGLSMGVALVFDLLSREPETGGGAWRWLALSGVAAGLIFVAAAVLESGSRMGAVAGGAGVLVVAVLAVVSSGGKWRSTTLIALVIVALIAAAVAVFGADTLARLELLDETDGQRTELYRQVLDAIALRPWLGYGGGSFITAFPAFQHPPLSGGSVWNKAHNTYLALWFEYGIVFGTIPVLVVASLLARALRGLFSRSSRPLTLAAAGAVVTFAVHSIVDFSLEISANVYLMLAILALGAAHVRATPQTEVRT